MQINPLCLSQHKKRIKGRLGETSWAIWTKNKHLEWGRSVKHGEFNFFHPTLLSFQVPSISCFVSVLLGWLVFWLTDFRVSLTHGRRYEEFPSKKRSCIHLQMVGKMWLPLTVHGWTRSRVLNPAVGAEADWFAIKILSQSLKLLQ